MSLVATPTPVKYRINLTREEAPQHCTYPYVLRFPMFSSGPAYAGGGSISAGVGLRRMEHEFLTLHTFNRGYRAGGDYKRCLQAAFELHTETLNAWTMVAGGVISIAMFMWVAVSTYPSAAALVPFAALTTAVLVHLPFSVGFHLFRGIDAEVYNLWRRLDQAFIFIVSVLIAFGLSWHAYSSWFGIALNTGAAALVAALGVREVRSLQPHFQRHRGQMVVFIGSIVLVYWFPMGYHAAKELVRGAPTAATAYALATFALLQLGGWVFAAGFPEKFLPGVFDLVGFSHQLMHVAVAGAHVLEYLFVWQLHQQSLLAVA